MLEISDSNIEYCLEQGITTRLRELCNTNHSYCAIRPICSILHTNSHLIRRTIMSPICDIHIKILFKELNSLLLKLQNGLGINNLRNNGPVIGTTANTIGVIENNTNINTLIDTIIEILNGLYYLYQTDISYIYDSIHNYMIFYILITIINNKTNYNITIAAGRCLCEIILHLNNTNDFDNNINLIINILSTLNSLLNTTETILLYNVLESIYKILIINKNLIDFNETENNELLMKLMDGIQWLLNYPVTNIRQRAEVITDYLEKINERI